MEQTMKPTAGELDMLKQAFVSWAVRNRFTPISRSSDARLSTAMLVRRSGKFVIETHAPLTRGQVEMNARMGIEQKHGFSYPFGVKALPASELAARLAQA